MTAAYADLVAAAQKVHALGEQKWNGTTAVEDAQQVLGDYSAAARTWVGLAACHQCGNAEIFSPGRFLGAYYIATCRLCGYIHIKTVPLTGGTA